jgi:creatinine amidohydrolase
MAIYRITPYMYSNLNWKDLERLKEKERFVLLLPIGSTESHGPHCPLGTDTIVSLETCLRAAQNLQATGYEAYVLPPLSYAVAEVTRSFPGSVSISPETDLTMIYEVCASLINQGMPRICLFNIHLEPAHVKAVYDAAKKVLHETGINILVVHIGSRKYRLRLSEAFQKGEAHADRWETSIVMAIAPSLVIEERRKKLKYVPIDLYDKKWADVAEFKAMGMPECYAGDPASASVEEGEETLATLTRFIVEGVEEMFQGEWREIEKK